MRVYDDIRKLYDVYLVYMRNSYSTDTKLYDGWETTSSAISSAIPGLSLRLKDSIRPVWRERIHEHHSVRNILGIGGSISR